MTKKIINYSSWLIIAATAILLFINWNRIPASVITHAGLGQISYGSKTMLIAVLTIEIIINFLFTLGYDMPFIQALRKTRTAKPAIRFTAVFLQIIAVIIMSLFILSAIP